MSAHPAPRGRGLVAGALTSVADWLVEPAPERQAAVDADREPFALPRPVVAVCGLRRRSGVTTVARAVGALLATGDPCGVSVVTSAAGDSSVPLGLPAAGRLARSLSPLVQGRVRACGRLCLVEGSHHEALRAVSRELAPLVLDVHEPAGAAAAASLADHVVLVAGPESEPALASVVAESLAAVGPQPVVLLNRCSRASDRWSGGEHVAVPESRLAAQIAGAGREPRGPMGQAVAGLVARWGVADRPGR